MQEPVIPQGPPFLWRSEGQWLLDYIKTIRPLPGIGTTVNQVEKIGTAVNANPQTGGGIVSARALAPFGFVPVEELTGGIWYHSRIYKDTSLTVQTITGLQSADRTTGNFTVAAGDIIYLKITQNSSAEITAASIECDAGGWADYPAMFELDAGDDYIQYIYITLHEVIADDSSGNNRPGVVVSDGSTTLKVARVWSGDMFAADFFSENGILTHRPLRYGG